MSKKKKTPVESSGVEEKDLVPVPVTTGPVVPVEVPAENGHLSLGLFDSASRELQKKRHEKIGSVFDSAAEVIQNYIADPNVEIGAKMFPAKLAVDLFVTQEKFRREDRKLDLEERRLELERLKISKEGGSSMPSIGTFNQQNNYLGQPTGQPSDLTDLKKKQEEILASYTKPKPTTEE